MSGALALREPYVRRLSTADVIDFVAESARVSGRSVKELARITDSPVKTVEKWYARENAPNLTNFINWCRNDPAFRPYAKQILFGEEEGSERELADLMQRYLRERGFV